MSDFVLLAKKIVRYFFKEPNIGLIIILDKLSFFLSDKLYVKMMFYLHMGYRLDLTNPRSFSEKIQWLKLYDHQPQYTRMTDKYEMKRIVNELIGPGFVIPVLGVWDNESDIDFSSLPNQFVLKTTHDSGGVLICRDKSNFDIVDARKKLKSHLVSDFYVKTKEWPYKNIKRRIIAEKYMENENGELWDYKFFCFDGIVKLIEVDYDRFVEHKRTLFTPEWENMNATIGFPSDEKNNIEKPSCLDEMIQVSQILSAGIPHLRVDFYCANNQFYVGELTFYHGGGFEKTTPESLNYTMGSWIKLPERRVKY